MKLKHDILGITDAFHLLGQRRYIAQLRSMVAAGIAQTKEVAERCALRRQPIINVVAPSSDPAVGR